MKTVQVTTKTILGRYIVLRKRLHKKRPFGYTEGACFHGLHGGRWSLYVSRRRPQKAVRVSITDK